MDRKNKYLLVSGTGFLGARIYQEFQNYSEEIQATARLAREKFLELNFEKSIPKQFEKKLQAQEYSHAIICAAITDIEQCYRNPEISNRINIDATIELLGLLKKYKIKPIFFSSDLVFSNTADLVDESEIHVHALEYFQMCFVKIRNKCVRIVVSMDLSSMNDLG